MAKDKRIAEANMQCYDRWPAFFRKETAKYGVPGGQIQYYLEQGYSMQAIVAALRQEQEEDDANHPASAARA